MYTRDEAYAWAKRAAQDLGYSLDEVILHALNCLHDDQDALEALSHRTNEEISGHIQRLLNENRKGAREEAKELERILELRLASRLQDAAGRIWEKVQPHHSNDAIRCITDPTLCPNPWWYIEQNFGPLSEA